MIWLNMRKGVTKKMIPGQEIVITDQDRLSQTNLMKADLQKIAKQIESMHYRAVGLDFPEDFLEAINAVKSSAEFATKHAEFNKFNLFRSIKQAQTEEKSNDAR